MGDIKPCPIAARKADVIKWLKESVEDACWHEPEVGIRGDSGLAAAFVELIEIVNNYTAKASGQPDELLAFIKKVSDIEYTGDDCGHESWKPDIVDIRDEAEALLAKSPKRESGGLELAAAALDKELTAWLEQMNAGKNPNNRAAFVKAFADFKIALSKIEGSHG